MAAVRPPLRPKRVTRMDSDSTPKQPPNFRLPQLATLLGNVPSGDSWLYEMKYDGYRAIAAVAGNQVRIFTPNGHAWTAQFGYLVPALRELTKGTALLDGEVCASDEHGRSNFSILKSSLDSKMPIVFFAFDLLEQDGEDVAALPQLERKERLQGLLSGLPDQSPIIYSQHVLGAGQQVLDAMCSGGFEGVIAKAATARYYGGERSTAV